MVRLKLSTGTGIDANWINELTGGGVMVEMKDTITVAEAAAMFEGVAKIATTEKPERVFEGYNDIETIAHRGGVLHVILRKEG